MDLHILRSPEYKNHIFSVWSVCMQVCDQIAIETSNLVFYFCIIYSYLKLFTKIGQKLCVQGQTKEFNTLRPMDWISYCWIFTYLDCGKYNEILIHVCDGQKHVYFIKWKELQARLIYRATQNNSGIWVTTAVNYRNFISCYFKQFSNKLDLKNTIRCIRVYIQCTGQSKIDQTCSFLNSFLS